jgi:polar amino acid transport system substrate-binding protein
MPVGRISVALALLAGGVIALAGPVAAQDEPLKVAIWNQGPFGGDPPGGFCHDLMEKIAERTGLRFTYVPMPAPQLIPSVVAGDVDLECSALAAPGRRNHGIVFAGPILTNQEAIIVQAGNETPFATLADFTGLRIGTTVNPGREAHIRAAGFEPVTFPNAQGAAAALAAGQIHAWMVNRAESPRLSRETPGLRLVETYQPTLVNYGMIGIAHGELVLIGTIQQALEELKIDGTLDAIADRWDVPPPPF